MAKFENIGYFLYAIPNLTNNNLEIKFSKFAEDWKIFTLYEINNLFYLYTDKLEALDTFETIPEALKYIINIYS